MSPLILAASILSIIPYGDSFGSRLCVLGDLDRDGLNEFIVTDPSYSIYAPGHPMPCGSVWVVHGGSGQVLYQIEGEVPGDPIGHEIAVGGDCDGDGAPDFLVSSIGRGVVEDTASWTLVSGASGKPLRHGVPRSPDGRVAVGLVARPTVEGGACVAIATSSISGPTIDVNFLSIASGESIEHRQLAGRGFVALETTNWMTTSASSSPWEILLTQSACRTPPYTNPLMGEDWDRTRLHVLNAQGNDEVPFTRDQPRHADLYFDLLAGFDLDGDGVPDRVMLIPTDERLDQYVAAISGASGGKLWSAADDSNAGNYLEHSLSWIRDEDGDSVMDVVVGSPEGDDVDQRLRILSGRTGKLIRVIPHVHDDMYERHFGSAICELGDLDGDGVTDLAIADMGIGADSHYPCFVRIVSGQSGKTLRTISRDERGPGLWSR